MAYFSFELTGALLYLKSSVLQNYKSNSNGAKNWIDTTSAYGELDNMRVYRH